MLNATYEPIGVVSGIRAVVLALADKVDVLAQSGESLTSERLEVPVPSVILLRYFVKVPLRRHGALNKKAVFARDRSSCQYCGNPAESIDHIRPKSRGGLHEWTNVVACCRRCNSKKGAWLLSECGMRLTSKPKAPSQLAWLKVAAGAVPSDWSPYLTRVAA